MPGGVHLTGCTSGCGGAPPPAPHPSTRPAPGAPMPRPACPLGPIPAPCPCRGSRPLSPTPWPARLPTVPRPAPCTWAPCPRTCAPLLPAALALARSLRVPLGTSPVASCPPLRSLALSGVLGGGRSGPGSPLLGLGLWGRRKCVPGGGAFHCCEGREGSGAPPPPTARPLGGLLGSSTHVLLARARVWGGPTLSPWPARPVGAACRGVGPWRSYAGGGGWGGGGGPCPPFVRPGGGCRAGGRSASFRPSAFPGQATRRVSGGRSVHGGRGPSYHSGSCSPAFTGRNLGGVLVRWRELARSLRFLWEPAAGAGGGGRAPAPLSGGGRGDHPPCLGGWGLGPPWLGWVGGGVAPRPPCSPSGWRPAVCHPGPPRVVSALPPGVHVRSGGDEGRPVDRSPGGPCRPEPPLCPA